MVMGSAVVLASHSSADDIKTVNGHEYKGATVTRVEPDGVVVMYSEGIVKIPFSDLSEEWQKRYGYEADKARAYAAQVEEQQRALAIANQQTLERVNAEKARQLQAAGEDAALRRRVAEAERQLPSVRIFAVIEPIRFDEDRTLAWIQPYRKYDTDERMSEAYESGDRAVVALYKIGHTDDSSRNPLYTGKSDKAIRVLAGGL